MVKHFIKWVQHAQGECVTFLASSIKSLELLPREHDLPERRVPKRFTGQTYKGILRSHGEGR
jgi:hypothetical protein